MENINQYLEHTNLSPLAGQKEIMQLIQEAKEHSLFGVCVPPYWVKAAHREVTDTPIKLITVVGFPLGYHISQVKREEARVAIEHGADEIDMVMNIGAMKSGGTHWVKTEVASLGKMCHEHGKLLKVILETAYLTEAEIVKACQICVDAGADFVKTSTGFASEGAKVEHVRLMKETVKDRAGIKAAGGIRNKQEALQMIEAGADRIGTSQGVKIASEV